MKKKEHRWLCERKKNTEKVTLAYYVDPTAPPRGSSPSGRFCANAKRSIAVPPIDAAPKNVLLSTLPSPPTPPKKLSKIKKEPSSHSNRVRPPSFARDYLCQSVTESSLLQRFCPQQPLKPNCWKSTFALQLGQKHLSLFMRDRSYL
ncbi:hypothetical protein TNIN_59521 [Trichonephila inaurata madagascariensis]|uniref:Uncharacterized protein n=1 Tax=Trichonephila inaurata madagascariensis TaxID=2747483 RepID=A0A8X6IHH4_9ARAC|nr:hypothetical protein TNIN_59521 [Trichonephila inaurata madagascariensis]